MRLGVESSALLFLFGLKGLYCLARDEESTVATNWHAVLADKNHAEFVADKVSPASDLSDKWTSSIELAEADGAAGGNRILKMMKKKKDITIVTEDNIIIQLFNFDGGFEDVMVRTNSPSPFDRMLLGNERQLQRGCSNPFYTRPGPYTFGRNCPSPRSPDPPEGAFVKCCSGTIQSATPYRALFPSRRRRSLQDNSLDIGAVAILVGDSTMELPYEDTIEYGEADEYL